MADWRWVPPPLPEDPGERRKVAMQLVILAAAGLIALIFSLVFR